ncbi:uncharacterized protein LOC132544323 [Ylistrum balloti]|uniref:uncharacterized protein LOC132544323 n=1 Tax=Ylistrum balloti TaxID=509963 RepID=UPI002905D048|nr:uncharacterized protein LOC132544323 [Ylistrum balloti]
MLKAYVKENQTDWDVQLPYLMMAYRSSVHDSTNFTPNYLMLGREIAMPVDVMIGKVPEESKKTVGQWVTFVQQSLQQAYTYVRQFTRASALRQKRYYDQRSANRKLKIKDRVWVYFPTVTPGTSPKLTAFWRGPFSVTKIVSDVTYEVCPVGGGRKQIVHVDRLKPCRDRSGDFDDAIRESDESGGEEDSGAEEHPAQELTPAGSGDIDLLNGVGSTALGDNSRPRRKRSIPNKFQDFYMYSVC